MSLPLTGADLRDAVRRNNGDQALATFEVMLDACDSSWELIAFQARRIRGAAERSLDVELQPEQDEAVLGAYLAGYLRGMAAGCGLELEAPS